MKRYNFKKGQLIKISDNCPESIIKNNKEKTGLVLRYSKVDYSGKFNIQFYKVLWMNKVHLMPETWIESL